MKYLFFDTETSGLPKNYKAPYTDVNNWPRIVQLAWVIADNQGVISEHNCIIKTDFLIPEESSKIHGITNEISQSQGQDIQSVLLEFLEALFESDLVVCHNLSFDWSVLRAELLRAHLDVNIQKPTFCTMKSTVDYCQLPGPYGFKWPKLEELYYKCFSEKLENAHNALIDVRATQRVFKKLVDDQVFQF